MTEQTPKIRLYVDADLRDGATITFATGQAHYLRNVMRRKPGDTVALFNGRDGEWRAVIADLGKAAGAATVDAQLRGQTPEPDVWLLFAPIKRARIDYLVEKASELGASALQPVLTARVNVERVNLARLTAHAIEAAEQCGRLVVPEVRPALALETLLSQWPAERSLIYGSPDPQAPAAAAVLSPLSLPAALLIGPEGGFAPEEEAALSRHPQTAAMRLGPRILRAETAALAALALLQSYIGDWRG